MKAITCELCKSNEFIKDGDYYQCQSCRTKYSVAEAQTMMTVKIDNSEKIENALSNARRARKDGNHKQAEKFYNMVLLENPNSWEAIFYATYYKAIQGSIANISVDADSVTRCLNTVLTIVKEIKEAKKQQEAITQIKDDLHSLTMFLQNAAIHTYNELDAMGKVNYEKQCADSVLNAAFIILSFGDELSSIFGEDEFTIPIIVRSYEAGIETMFNAFDAKHFTQEFLNGYASKIKKHKPEYQLATKKSGGCYIATAVYGSYNSPEVRTLRKFRDNTLSQNFFGRLFIKFYYKTSPTLVKYFGNTETFNSFCKCQLDKLVAKLERK